MNNCRSCNASLGEPFLSFGTSPLSNSYLSKKQLQQFEPTYPLDLYLCERCYLMQLDVFESAQKIFSHEYAYFSSCSDSWLQHCKSYVEMMCERFAITPEWFVVEIASNDGYLLQFFKEKGIPHLGIEPALQTAFAAVKKGIPTEAEYFTLEFAEKMIRNRQSANLIIGNNVLAHNPNLNDFVEGMKQLLKPEGIITMEFPHVLKMLENVEFDTIYHEHFSYLSFYSVKTLFEKHCLSIFDVEELPTHGGSLRIYAQHTNTGKQAVLKSVNDLIEKERINGIFSTELYTRFSENVKRVKRYLLSTLIEIKRQNKKIAGYGAPAKGNTLLNYCGIRTDFIDFTVDRNPMKQGKFLPGSRIPIYEPDVIFKAKPDYLFILPWNIKTEVMQQMKEIKSWGGKFLIAIPEVEII